MAKKQQPKIKSPIFLWLPNSTWVTPQRVTDKWEGLMQTQFVPACAGFLALVPKSFCVPSLESWSANYFCSPCARRIGVRAWKNIQYFKNTILAPECTDLITGGLRGKKIFVNPFTNLPPQSQPPPPPHRFRPPRGS